MKKPLINTKADLTFKNWVKQHNPKEKWNWNDPVVLEAQLINAIRTSGHPVI